MAGYTRPPWARAIRQERERRAWSQEVLAEAVGVDRTTAARWEAGVQKPQRQLMLRICHTFAMSADALGFVESDADEEDEVKRRDFNRLLGLGVVAAAGEPWERLMHALRPGGQVDAAVLPHLEQMTVSLSELERTVMAPATILSGVTGHLDTLTGFLQGGRVDAAARRQLCSLAAETAALAGWLTWDLDDQERADAYFRTGLEAAREAGDAAMGAYLAGSIYYAPMHREDPNRRLARLRGRVLGFGAVDASPHTRAWLAILEAEAEAMLGHGSEFDRLTACALEGLQREDPDGQRRPRVVFFDAPYLAESRAAGLLRLGRLREASGVLVEALPQTAGRMRLWMLTDLAEACAAQDEPEQAALYADEALTGAAGGQLGPILASLRGLPAGEFAPYSAVPAVREFTERLATA